MDSLLKKIDYKLNILRECVKEDKEELNSIINSIYILYSDVYFNDESKEIFLEKLSNDNIIERMNTLASNHILVQSKKDEYNSTKIDIDLSSTVYDVCDLCNNSVSLGEYSSMIICSYCGHIKYITNNSKSLPRSKIGNFKPQRHFKIWMERILGREPESEIKCVNMDIVDVIRKDLINKNKSIEHITIDDIRYVLKEIGKTNLNKNTTLLSKKITGRSPPYINDTLYKKTNDLFIKVMNARDSLSNNRCNRIYYPYYIYKIFNIILTGEEKKITNYIHLHKSSTTCQNDSEWISICDLVPELNGKYCPTILSNSRYI